MKRRHPTVNSLVDALENEGYQVLAGEENFVEVKAADGHTYIVHFSVSTDEIFVERMERSDFEADEF